MSNNPKILISSDLLEHIITEDPEFEVAIKQAVVENVMKRTIKAIVPTEVRGQIGEIVREETRAALAIEFGTIKTVYGASPSLLIKDLKPTIRTAIRKEIESTVREIVEEEVGNVREYAVKVAEENKAMIDDYIINYLRAHLKDLFNTKINAVVRFMTEEQE